MTFSQPVVPKVPWLRSVFGREAISSCLGFRQEARISALPSVLYFESSVVRFPFQALFQLLRIPAKTVSLNIVILLV